MMRGELDNGKPRYDKTYEAGYTEEERAKAQSIVNKKDWQGLKERHDARVANNINENPTENNKPATQEQTALVEQPKTEPKPANNIKTETKVEEKKETANASPKKPKDPLNTYADDNGPKYASGVESKNGLTLN